MNDIAHIDKPSSSLIRNLNQDIVGWFARSKKSIGKLSFKINGMTCHAILSPRPDVEKALNTGRSDDIAATGWLIRVDKEVTYKTRGRTFEISIFCDDNLVYERIFYRCAALRTEIDSAPLIFMHIPKTGGTALRQFIEHAFIDWPTLNIYEDYPGVKAAEIKELDDQFLASREIVFGHFAYNFDERIAKLNAKYFVVVRRPKELVNSYINYTRDYDPNLLDNPLVRYISGCYGKVPFGALSEVHLERAIRNIESQFYVIQADKLQLFSEEMSALLGLRCMEIPRINEGKYGEQTAHPAVSTLTHLDDRLYEYSLHLEQNLRHFLVGVAPRNRC